MNSLHTGTTPETWLSQTQHTHGQVSHTFSQPGVAWLWGQGMSPSWFAWLLLTIVCTALVQRDNVKAVKAGISQSANSSTIQFNKHRHISLSNANTSQTTAHSAEVLKS